MGFRSQFESLLTFYSRWQGAADIYMIYGKEAFPQESRWPAPVPDGDPVFAATTEDERRANAERFAQDYGDDIPILVDGVENQGMALFDAYPFRVYALDTEGRIAVLSQKGATGFEPTLQRIAAWLEQGAPAADPTGPSKAE